MAAPPGTAENQRAIQLRSAASRMAMPKETIQAIDSQRMVEAQKINDDLVRNLSTHGSSYFNTIIRDDFKKWAANGGLGENVSVQFDEDTLNNMVREATGQDVIRDLLDLGYNAQQIKKYMMSGSYFGTSKESADITAALMNRRMDEIDRDPIFIEAWDSARSKLESARNHNEKEVDLTDVERGALRTFGKIRLMQEAQMMAEMIADVRSLDSDSTRIANLEVDDENRMINLFGPAGTEIIRTNGRTPLEKVQAIAKGAERDLAYGLRAAALFQDSALENNTVDVDDVYAIVNPQVSGTSDPLDIVATISRSPKFNGATGKKILGNTESEQDYKNRNIAVIQTRLGQIAAAIGAPLSRIDEMEITFGLNSPQYRFARKYHNGETPARNDIPYMLTRDDAGHLIMNTDYFDQLRVLKGDIDAMYQGGVVGNYQPTGQNSHLHDTALATAVNQLGSAVLKATAQLAQYIDTHRGSQDADDAQAILADVLDGMGLDPNVGVRLENGNTMTLMEAVLGLNNIAEVSMDPANLMQRDVNRGIRVGRLIQDSVQTQGQFTQRDVGAIARSLLLGFVTPTP
jgi:hypothetical protein